MDEFNLEGYLNEEETTPSAEPEVEEVAEEAEEQNTEVNAGESSESQPQEPETIDFKHNKQVIPLNKKTVDEIASALGMDARQLTDTLQKGVAYDSKMEKYSNVDEQLNRLASIDSRMDAYARSLNVDREGVFKFLEAAKDRAILRSITDQVMLQHPDWSESAINEYSQLKLNEQKRAEEAETARISEQKERQANQMFVDFFTAHPEMTFDNMPQKLKDDIVEGMHPEQAYLKYQNEQKNKEIETMKAEIAKAQKAAENKAKSIGSTAAEVGGGADELLEAFMSAFR